MEALLDVAIVLISIAAFLLIATLIIFERLTRRRATSDGLSTARYYPEPQRSECRAKLLAGQEYLRLREGRTLEIRSADGLKLSGVLYPADTVGKRCVIFFHGYHGSGFGDFALYAHYWFARGYMALVVDQRAHAKNEGTYLTLGVKESDDALRWAREAVRLLGPDTSIVLSGVSMGAATVMSASDLGLPPQVRAIIADCGYTRPYDEIRSGLRFMHIPHFPTMQIGSLWCQILAKFDTHASGAIDALARTDIPILFIHGDCDSFVPVNMSRQNFAACASKAKQLLIVEGANHAGSYLVDPVHYEQVLADFLGRLSL